MSKTKHTIKHGIFKNERAKQYFIEERKDSLDIRKEILKRYHRRTSNWRDLADCVYSEYIRLTKSNNGICTCITCGRKYKWREIQNGHFITRGNLLFRFDDSNCYPQCLYCNVMLHGNYQRYTMKMIEMLGKDRVEYMLNNKNIHHYTQGRYEKHIFERYKVIKVLENKYK